MFEKESSEQSPGEKKVNEYVERIRSGENQESILDGLPESFRQGILNRLKGEVGDNRLDDMMAADDIREKIMHPEKAKEDKDTFEEFSMANGETDTGAFWNQYKNEEAKRLKEAGKFTWGEERIYFDVPVSDMEKLRDVVMRVASEGKVAIAFKYLDDKKTYASQMDGSETRFVANFASREDAKRLFVALRATPEYQSIVPDRKLDYKGVRVDDIAEYASGFRERRDALERIARGASLNGQTGMYEYQLESGKTIALRPEEYERFSEEYSNALESWRAIEQEWRDLSGESYNEGELFGNVP